MKFFKIFILTLLCATPAAAQVAVSGSLRDITGTIVATNAEVDFELQNYRGLIPRISGTGVIAQVKKVFKPDNAGAIHCVGSGCTDTVYQNSIITPAGTFYSVCIIVKGETLRCNNYLINGAFDLNSATPLNAGTNVGPGFNILPCFVFQQATTSLTWTITHNLSDLNTFVETADLNGILIFPPVGGVNLSNPNVAVITWSSPQAGRAMICHSTQLNIATNQPDAIVSHPLGPQRINGQPLSIDTLTPGKCVQAGTNGELDSATGGCGGGVTSVSDGGFAPLFTTNVANPTTTPAITETAISQNANMFYAGPSGTATDLVDFAVVTATGTASPISISATPHQSGDFALLSAVRDGGGGAAFFTPDVSWTDSGLNNGTQRFFYKTISGFSTASASGSIGSSPNWAATLALLTPKAGFTPAVTNAGVIASGAWASFTNLTAGFTPTAGRTLIAVIMSGQTSLSACPGPVSVATFTDSVGDVFVPLTYVVNNAGQGTQLTVLAASNIVGGVTTFSNAMAWATAPFPLSCSLANGLAVVFEVTNLAPVSPTLRPPTFRYAVGTDLPFPTPVSLGGILSKAAVANQFLTSINKDGTIGQAAITAANLPATTSNCTGTNFAQGLNAGGTPICTSGAGTAVQVFSATTLGGDVSVSATTQTDVMTRTVSMPASGCPCRAFMSYSLYITTASSGVGYSAWVNDGSVNMAGTNAGQSNGSSGALTSLSFGGYSTATYSNNASVTFTLRTEGGHAYTVRAASQVAGSAPNSSFQVAISTSN